MQVVRNKHGCAHQTTASIIYRTAIHPPQPYAHRNVSKYFPVKRCSALLIGASGQN